MKISTYLFSLFILLFVSCTDPCKDAKCNSGTCDEGICVCDTGYEGNHCDIEWRTKFLGEWDGIVSCGSELDDLKITISSDPNSITDVLLTNGDGQVLKGTSDAVKLIIPEQNDDGEIFKGVVQLISPNKIELIISSTTGNDTETCIFTGTKQ